MQLEDIFSYYRDNASLLIAQKLKNQIYNRSRCWFRLRHRRRPGGRSDRPNGIPRRVLGGRLPRARRRCRPDRPRSGSVAARRPGTEPVDGGRGTFRVERGLGSGGHRNADRLGTRRRRRRGRTGRCVGPFPVPRSPVAEPSAVAVDAVPRVGRSAGGEHPGRLVLVCSASPVGNSATGCPPERFAPGPHPAVTGPGCPRTETCGHPWSVPKPGQHQMRLNDWATTGRGRDPDRRDRVHLQCDLRRDRAPPAGSPFEAPGWSHPTTD